jgi:hypothetical protein
MSLVDLSFPVDIVRPGDYHLWVRLKGPDYPDDSLCVTSRLEAGALRCIEATSASGELP